MAPEPQSDRSLFRWVAVTHDDLDPGLAAAFVESPRSGASVIFLGTVRDHAPGKSGVTHLEYEAYEGVVVDKIADVVDEALAKWPLEKVVALHRVGTLDVGEVSVIAAASSAHRADAFDGARYIIDELKRRAPIWKKEHWDGGAAWVREDLEQGDG